MSSSLPCVTIYIQLPSRQHALLPQFLESRFDVLNRNAPSPHPIDIQGRNTPEIHGARPSLILYKYFQSGYNLFHLTSSIFLISARPFC